MSDPVPSSKNGPSRSQISSNWRARNTSEATASPQISRLCWVRPGSGEVVSPQSTEPTESTRAGEDAKKAISEGRRLYVGNLPYMAKKDDVAGIFDSSDYVVERISMSLDPFTGRNPSYCFVDLQHKQQADNSIQMLNGREVLGRPVKIGPGVAKPRGAGLRDGSPSWKSQNQQPSVSYDRWEKNDAADHWKGYTEQGRRLFVGGLPRMSNHYDVEKGVRQFFHGYNIECVSKVIVPPSHDRGKPEKRGWDDRYLFVDFATADEAEHAVKAKNGVQSWGVKVRVEKNKIGDSWKVGERQAWEEAQLELQIPNISKEYRLSTQGFD